MTTPGISAGGPRWARILAGVGWVALLVGAIDPLEGAFAIAPGAAVLLLSSWLAGRAGSGWRWRALGTALVLAGVVAMFGLSSGGGIGGSTGRSLWWGLAILPYPVGWLLLVAGPTAPRVVAAGAAVVGAWYVALPAFILHRAPAGRLPRQSGFLILLGIFGLTVMLAGGWRCVRRRPVPAAGPASP